MITLDYRDRRPIYEQIVEKFEILILNKVIKEEELMPSVRSLATELGINPNTIQKAYVVLENKGYIYTIVGKGSFVSSVDKLVEKKKNGVKKKLVDVINEAKIYCVDKNEINSIVNKIYYGTKGVNN